MRAFVYFGLTLALFGSERRLPPQLEAIAQLALSAPPELAASALLKIEESGQVASQSTRIDLLEQAFDLAGQAHFKVKMRAIESVPADSDLGSLAKAYALDLDAASLRARAVLAMAPIDKSKARDMFLAMSLPDLPPLDCTDGLVYDPAAFYRALAAIVAAGFTPKEKIHEDHVAFLLGYLGEIRNAAQLAPMLAAADAAGLTPVQREAVDARLGGALETLFGDPRSLAAAIAGLRGSIPPDLTSSFARFVANNSKTSCDAAPKFDSYWQSASARRLLEAGRNLRFGIPASNVLTEAERALPEWRARLEDFEKDLAGWPSSDEKTSAAFYQQKCIVFESLVDLIPKGPDRDRALEAFVQFMSNSRLAESDPASWFVPATALLERARGNGGEPSKILAAFESGGSPALALYAALEGVLAKPYPTWMGTGSF